MTVTSIIVNFIAHTRKLCYSIREKGCSCMILEKIGQLVAQCSDPEKKLVERMILSASNYVKAVTEMETHALNFVGRPDQELRDVVSESDTARTRAHDSLIASINIVNRICEAHGFDVLYTGDSLRRHYGDFALELVCEIFNQRR